MEKFKYAYSSISSKLLNLNKSSEQYYSTTTQQLNGNDLKEVFQNTVIPVTEEDYHNREHFQNVNEIQRKRTQNINPMNEAECNRYFLNKSNNETKEANNIAYKLMKEAENNEMQQGLFWSHLRTLQYGRK